MKFGLAVGHIDDAIPSFPKWLRWCARSAEDVGLDSFWMWDHFQRFVDGTPRPILEAWTALGFLAASTSRITLGTLVSSVTHRHPAVLIKQATTLDVLAGGRSVFGIGAGWNADEHQRFGIEFPDLKERLDLVEDVARAARKIWSGDTGPFIGRRLRLSSQVDVPAPVRPGGPRILVAGGGERRTLPIAAAHADAAHFVTPDPAAYALKNAILTASAIGAGRDPADIERLSDLPFPLHGPAPPFELLLERATVLAGGGAEHLLVEVSDENAREVLEVLPKLSSALAAHANGP